MKVFLTILLTVTPIIMLSLWFAATANTDCSCFIYERPVLLHVHPEKDRRTAELLDQYPEMLKYILDWILTGNYPKDIMNPSDFDYIISKDEYISKGDTSHAKALLSLLLKEDSPLTDAMSLKK